MHCFRFLGWSVGFLPPPPPPGLGECACMQRVMPLDYNSLIRCNLFITWLHRFFPILLGTRISLCGGDSGFDRFSSNNGSTAAAAAKPLSLVSLFTNINGSFQTAAESAVIFVWHSLFPFPYLWATVSVGSFEAKEQKMCQSERSYNAGFHCRIYMLP